MPFIEVLVLVGLTRLCLSLIASVGASAYACYANLLRATRYC